MARRRSGGARLLRDLVDELSDRSDIRYGKRRVATVDAIHAAIGAVLDARVADRCRPGPILGTEAVVECESAAVAQRVAMAAPEILQHTRDRIGTDDVQSIRVSVVSVRRQAPRCGLASE